MQSKLQALPEASPEVGKGLVPFRPVHVGCEAAGDKPQPYFRELRYNAVAGASSKSTSHSVD